jgi:transposase, IS6 family
MTFYSSRMLPGCRSSSGKRGAKISVSCMIALSHASNSFLQACSLDVIPSPSNGSTTPPDVILLRVRWYCRYSLSYRDLEEMMRERGLSVDHVTVFRWVQRYAPGINKRMRPYLKMSVNETYMKVGTEWKYLYRAVDSAGDTIELMLSAKRDVSAAKRFFRKLMRADHRQLPYTIGTDKYASYPEAFATSVKEKVLPSDCKLRRVKHLSKVIEQDQRVIRRRWRTMHCFRSFHTTEQTIEEIEAAHMMRKG